MGLEGARAFVSGSTRGIGAAIAEALAREGAEVVLNGRSESGVDAAVARLRGVAPASAVSGIAADLADADATAELLRRLGEVDVLVNNAGAFDVAPFADIDDAAWQRCLDVNLLSAVRLTRGLLGGMLDRGHGRVILVASESGVNVPADMIPYGVTKAGMLALGNGLAKLTRGTAVTVNTVLGGPTYSDGVADAVEALAAAQGLPAAELRTAIIGANRTSLVERFLEPAEIASLVVYLASPLSSATNGAALRADGGVLTSLL
ncbi:SDR family NAD(P)-dependent oxidoreductase [Pseudolysinimonas sp.]|uniref:SDR family NAD(P)-dependent oxidoreductase n=1 Tax=Pseudolysinimonas sp. TaxID=2680009 RepID=UPI003F801D00